MSNKEDFLCSCLILDTETTGKDYKTASIIESGFVIREDGDWAIFQELHTPDENIVPAEVSAICYITNSMVQDKPPFVKSSDTFQAVVDGYSEGYLVAHNHFYDMRVLERHGINTANHKWICTWRMAKKLFSDVSDITETNLPYLRFALKLDVPIEMHCHRAGNDSFITGRLLESFVDIMEGKGLLNPTKAYGPQIAEWAAAPIVYTHMPFGKHKGEPMKSVPTSYWNWAMKNTNWFDETADNFDPDLMSSIHTALE